jgi:ubiquitin carboxyl-terminal hydrolase 4/11/15
VLSPRELQLPHRRFARPAASLSLAGKATRFPQTLFCLALELHRLHGRRPSFKTASTKKRKIAPAQDHESPPAESTVTHSVTVNEGRALTSPRSSPLPASIGIRTSASPPRFLPPHMHDEILEAAHESGAAAARDPPSAASSPSEAYANMTLDGEPMSDADRTRAPEHRPHPRASSPAKRPHSDVDDGKMDVDGPSSARRGSGQSSPRSTKPLSSATQRPLRATSIEMTDAVSNGGSAVSSDSNGASNANSSATSVSGTPAANAPSLEDQVDKVLAISRKGLQDRQVGYVVSQKWLERVWARTPQYAGKQREFSKSATEGDIGPIDNSDLVDTGTGTMLQS